MATTVTEVSALSSTSSTKTTTVLTSGRYDKQPSSTMRGDIRVLNMDRAKSVLKRELFDWVDNDSVLKKLGLQTVQIAFTKDGRFALIVARASLTGQFGLRLATLDPHHRLTTYLLGVSFSLESALLHSAARVQQLEDEIDEMEKTWRHGDVIHVEHLGYSHVAIYDAVNQVFYELIGDIDSGKDAFLAQANAALEWRREITEATRNQLTKALSLFKSPFVATETQTEEHTSVQSTVVNKESPDGQNTTTTISSMRTMTKESRTTTTTPTAEEQEMDTHSTASSPSVSTKSRMRRELKVRSLSFSSTTPRDGTSTTCSTENADLSSSDISFKSDLASTESSLPHRTLLTQGDEMDHPTDAVSVPAVHLHLLGSPQPLRSGSVSLSSSANDAPFDPKEYWKTISPSSHRKMTLEQVLKSYANGSMSPTSRTPRSTLEANRISLDSFLARSGHVLSASAEQLKSPPMSHTPHSLFQRKRSLSSSTSAKLSKSYHGIDDNNLGSAYALLKDGKGAVKEDAEEEELNDHEPVQQNKQQNQQQNQQQQNQDDNDWPSNDPYFGTSTDLYDAPMQWNAATNNLRHLATSTDDIGLNALLNEDEVTYFKSAEHDGSIQPDDTCPAMAFGFPSHSIAEVQATPKDIFLTRDPLLKKRVQYYANALPPEVVVARAKSAVGSPGWNPITRNCEHFATWAKTGRTVSTQVFEIGSNAAILGASTLQAVVTLAFLGLTFVWFLSRFLSSNVIMDTLEACFAWLLKLGVLVCSIVFAVGILVHWQNGTSADFDSWVLQQQTVTVSTQNANNTTTTTTTTSTIST